MIIHNYHQQVQEAARLHAELLAALTDDPAVLDVEVYDDAVMITLKESEA